MKKVFFALTAMFASSAWAQQIPSAQRVSLSDSTVQATPRGLLSSPLTLKQAFDAAWQRQPEAKSQLVRQNAAMARSQAADSWSAEPAVFEVSGKTDRLNKNQGSREIVAGV